MLSKQVYKIRQTDNVNQVAEKLGRNIVGKECRLSFKWGNLLPSEVRVYLINKKSMSGPVLGLTSDDLEKVDEKEN
jgi:hypothetical protein